MNNKDIDDVVVDPASKNDSGQFQKIIDRLDNIDLRLDKLEVLHTNIDSRLSGLSEEIDDLRDENSYRYVARQYLGNAPQVSLARNDVNYTERRPISGGNISGDDKNDFLSYFDQG